MKNESKPALRSKLSMSLSGVDIAMSVFTHEDWLEKRKQIQPKPVMGENQKPAGPLTDPNSSGS